VDWIRWEKCCHDPIGSAMWLGMHVARSIHDQFEVLCGLEQMIEDDVKT
jgi:hypothetical protein